MFETLSNSSCFFAIPQFDLRNHSSTFGHNCIDANLSTLDFTFVSFACVCVTFSPACAFFSSIYPVVCFFSPIVRVVSEFKSLRAAHPDQPLAVSVLRALTHVIGAASTMQELSRELDESLASLKAAVSFFVFPLRHH
jgi:hypothetical protein